MRKRISIMHFMVTYYARAALYKAQHYPLYYSRVWPFAAGLMLGLLLMSWSVQVAR